MNRRLFLASVLAPRSAGDARTAAGMELRWCPPGRFRMGSPEEEPGHRPDERQVEVELTHGFWMGRFEVTQAQWAETVGAFVQPMQHGTGPRHPVYWVNYEEALKFCRLLTARAHSAGELEPDWIFHLPTEAQWEYACRAGTTAATAFGSRLSHVQANFSGVPYNGGQGGPSPGVSSPVGSYPANAWGLHDMHGNIFEWCRDWYHSALPGGRDPDLSCRQGQPNRDGTYSRVRRGGAWNDPGAFLRSALRLRYEPERRSDHIGFRAVAVPASTTVCLDYSMLVRSVLLRIPNA